MDYYAVPLMLYLPPQLDYRKALTYVTKALDLVDQKVAQPAPKGVGGMEEV